MLYSSLHADMHICTLMHHLKFYRLFFFFFEDLQTFGMDPCMIQILVFSIKFNMFEMSTICRHENTTGVIFITHFVSRQRGISFNKIVNNIFFLQKRYIQCTSYCTGNSKAWVFIFNDWPSMKRNYHIDNSWKKNFLIRIMYSSMNCR